MKCLEQCGKASNSPAFSGVAREKLLGKKHAVPIRSVKHLFHFEDFLGLADELRKFLGLMATVFWRHYGRPLHRFDGDN
jgi:hypothetical protein